MMKLCSSSPLLIRKMLVNMQRYKDNVALVTGASAGIGATTALKLAQNGMRVVICARRLDRLKKLCLSAKKNLFAYKCDLTEAKEVKAMMEWIERTLGPLEVVINNAGVMKYGRLLDQSPRDWEVMTDLNLLAGTYVTQLAIENMVVRNSGTVIFINSMAGHVENDNCMTTMYNATKYALTILIDSWRQEIAEKGLNQVRIGSISPGLVETEIVKAAFPQDHGQFSRQIFSTFPSLNPEDIADLVENLLVTPQHVQLQDLQVTHVLSGMQNNYSEEKEVEMEQTQL